MTPNMSHNTSPNLAHHRPAAHHGPAVHHGPAARHGPSHSQALAPALDALPRDASRPAQTRFTRALQAAFLRRLADSGEVRVAVSALSVSHQTVYRMRRACRVFARGWDAALVIARERAEDMLASRAMHGVEEEVYYHGEVVATRRRYDARLLLAHLARLDRKAERADIAGLAENFDAVVEAFETHASGGQGPETASGFEDQTTPDASLSEEALDCTPITLAPGPSEKASGPCNTWSMSQAEARDPQSQGSMAHKPLPDEPLPDKPMPDAPVAPPDLERRLQAMEAARPDDAPTPRELAQGWPLGGDAEWDAAGASPLDGGARVSLDPPDAGAIEAAQLAAFEAGEARWWRVTRERAAGSARDDVECDARVASADQAKLAGGAA
ncbi:MAG: hypothetical protein AAF291_13170 [Pseudomonadota bacterium]